MNSHLLNCAISEGALILKTQNHLLYSKVNGKFEGVYFDNLNKLNTKDWDYVCTMKEYYERMRGDAEKKMIAAADVCDEKAKEYWEQEYLTYDKAAKSQGGKT